MPPFVWMIVGLLITSLVIVPANPAGAQTPPTDLRSFITAAHAHGLPYAEAHAYGPAAVPELVTMFSDPSMEPNWTKVVAALGCIEDASAVQPLMDFMKRFQGPVSADVLRAVLSVLPALGQIAYRGDPTALQIILDFADPGAYLKYGIGFSYGRYSGPRLVEVLGPMDIMALGVSGRPEALALLKKMLDDPAFRQDWRPNVTEAIEVNGKMSTLGPEKVFGAGL